MTRTSVAAAVLALAAVSLPAATAAAFDSVEEVLCTCVEDVLSTGDYVSCLSHMTRRLVARGLIGRAERTDLLREASATDLPALQDLCASAGGGGDLEGWGVSLQIRRPFYPAPSPSGPVGGAEATLRLWNMTPEEIHQTTPVFPEGEGCEFLVRVLDGKDRVVRRVNVGCVEVIGELDMAPGDVLERVHFLVPLLAENADPDTGLADGDALPPGVYRLEVAWNAHGPQKLNQPPAMEGGFPMAVITLRVG